MRWIHLVPVTLIAVGIWSFSCLDGNRVAPEDDLDLTGLLAVRVEPAELTLESTPSQPAGYRYKAIGTFAGGERDITALATFTTDHPGVGGFAGAQFQGTGSQGGDTKVWAHAAQIGTAAHLRVHFSATVKIEPPAGGSPLPADPSSRFQGAPVPARAPQLVYPNDGVMIPPNIQSLEVHFKPGPAANNLFQLSFQSDTAAITTYTRCGNLINGGCVVLLDPVTYAYVTNSNGGGGPPVILRVRAGDDNATDFGQSAEFRLQLAQENLNGALYYWTPSNGGAIMRVDFGGATLTPSRFLSQAQYGFPNCVGCHAISRDGSKMVASIGGINDGRTVYIADLTAKPASLLTLDGSSAASGANHIQFASFSPAGDRFVAVYGDTPDLTERYKLWMHDGGTGLRLPGESITLTFEPDHPDWSPDGRQIAFTHVGTHNVSQRPKNSGVDVITKGGSGWQPAVTVVPIQAGRNRYNPNFAPDSSFFVYSESVCPGGDINSSLCNGDADPSAKTWAVKPLAAAPPVYLAQANAPGITDGSNTDLSNSFPRFSPFQQRQGSGRLYWVTIASRRQLGLRNPPPTPANADPTEFGTSGQVLWMFAVDPDKVAAGQDGSYPAFYLPFQDLTTSNHIGQWTQRVVSPG